MAEGLVLPGARRAALCFLLVCFTLGTPRLNAQQISATQSKEKVPVFHVFDPARNETVISVGPLDKGILAEIGLLAGSLPSPTATSTHFPARLALKNAYYAYPGKSPSRPLTVGFVFLAGREEEKYKDGLDFSISVEGSQIHQGKMIYGQLTFPAGYVSTITAELPTDLFLRVAQSRKARFQIGRRSYELGGGQRKQLRALVESIEGLSR